MMFKQLLSAICVLIAVSACKPSEHFIRNRVVKLLGERGQCTGEQVLAPSGQKYILTAAHCLGLADERGDITVETEDGKQIKRRVVAEDDKSDLLLLEGVPGLSGLRVAPSVSRFQFLRTFTHGSGLPTYKTVGYVIGEETSRFISAQPEPCSMPKQKKLKIDVFFGVVFAEVCLIETQQTVTDALAVPGSSGGPVVDDQGELIGVVSAVGEHFTFLVRLADIQNFIKGY